MKEKKERGRRRRGREEEEEEEKFAKGMEILKFWYGFFMESKKLMVLYGFLGIFMSSKPRV